MFLGLEPALAALNHPGSATYRVVDEHQRRRHVDQALVVARPSTP